MRVQTWLRIEGELITLNFLHFKKGGKVFLESGRGFVGIVVLFLCQVKMDYHSGKSRGFGFVNFKSPEVRQKVLSQVHYIQGRNCHVREPGSKVSTRSRLGLVFVFVYYLIQ